MSEIKITWQEGQHSGELPISIERPIVIGRDSNADIELTDRKVSRQHARLENLGDHLHIHNLSRSNPILVNNLLLAPNQGARLNPGDTLRIGDVHMQIEGIETSHAHSAAVLVRCPNCKRQIDLSHKDCPYCGYHLAGGVTLI
ncbi:MAG TPA: FHA domain-containing protein [Anaerolineae bacterium]